MPLFFILGTQSTSLCPPLLKPDRNGLHTDGFQGGGTCTNDYAHMPHASRPLVAFYINKLAENVPDLYQIAGIVHDYVYVFVGAGNLIQELL